MTPDTYLASVMPCCVSPWRASEIGPNGRKIQRVGAVPTALGAIRHAGPPLKDGPACRGSLLAADLDDRLRQRCFRLNSLRVGLEVTLGGDQIDEFLGNIHV